MKKKTILSMCGVVVVSTLVSCGLQGGQKAWANESVEAQEGLDQTETTLTDDAENTDFSNALEAAETTNANSRETSNLELPAFRHDSGEKILQREGYTVSYNKTTRQPNWVAWHLTADHVDGPYKRKGVSFREDEEVAEPRATNADYTSSGYDRGHMCPSGDCRWSKIAQQESFLFTNVCPQVHGLNAGDWNEMEQQCRTWAERYGDLYIVCGPVLFGKSRHKTIGRNKVVVPEAFFKVVLRAGNDTAAIGFIYRNQSGNRPKGDYVNSIDEVERITGYDFFPQLPDRVERRVEAEADIDAWWH